MPDGTIVSRPVQEMVRQRVPRRRLTPRDQQVLLALGSAEGLSTESLATAHFRDQFTYALRRLTVLDARGLITYPGLRGPHHVWALSRAHLT